MANQSEARKREAAIKRLTRKEKLELIKHNLIKKLLEPPRATRQKFPLDFAPFCVY